MIQCCDGARCFLCKGKEKVTAERALLLLTYDLRRAINLLDAGVFAARIRERVAQKRG